MEPQLKHPLAHRYGEDHHHQHAGLEGGDEEQHGEKKSVLKKVKAKAKKIKETIKKHGHLHGHEHDRDHGQQGRDPEYEEEDEDDDEDEEVDDEDEEVEKDPEIHGAPICESQVARNPVVGLEASQGPHRQQPNLERTDEPAVGRDHARLGVPMSHAHQGLGMDAGVIGGSTIGRLIIPEEAPVAPRNTPISHGEDQPRVTEKLPVPSLHEDPGGPRHTLSEPYRPGNYQAKVSDPTGAGAKETPGIAPLLRSLDKMSVGEPEPNGQSAESHGQFSPKTERESKYRDMPDNSPLITGEAVQQDIAPQGGVTEKLAFVTAALADKVVAAKDAAASKLGYGDEKKDEAPSDQTSYTEKASHAASLLADKAIGAKDGVASKLGYGGTGEHKTPREPVDHEALMRQQQSSYTERLAGVTADVTSALAEKVAEAKNVVASKLGYDQEGVGAAKASDPDQAAPSQGSMAFSIADKAAQVKSAVASKLGYTGGGDSAEATTWTEKLKPGDEDRALSELISSTVCKKKEPEPTQPEPVKGKTPVSETVSDAIHKRASDEDDELKQRREVKLMGRVTESDEVARRLGTTEEEKRGEVTHVPGSESPRKVVAKIKDTVTSWWTAGNQTSSQAPQPPADSSQSGIGERRLQESAN